MATLEDTNLSKEFDRVTNAVYSTAGAANATSTAVNVASTLNIEKLNELIKILQEMNKGKSPLEATEEAAKTKNNGQLTEFEQGVNYSLLDIERDATYSYTSSWRIETMLADHFAVLAERAEEEKDRQEKADESARAKLEELSGSLTEYFEEVTEKDDEKNDKGIIGNMIGGIKGFFGGMFSSGLGKLFKGLQVSITKPTIKDFVGAFKPLIAAAGIGGGGSKQKQGFKGAVGSKVGQAAGKGVGSLVGTIATQITKIGAAIVRFINLMCAGIPLIPPLLIAALVIVIGLYFIVDLIITTFYPLFEMLTNTICEFFPQVLEAIMAASPFGALALMVKYICKLIAAMAGVDMDNPTAKREEEDPPYEDVLDDILSELAYIATWVRFAIRGGKEPKEVSLKSTAKDVVKPENGVVESEKVENNKVSEKFNNVSKTISNSSSKNVESDVTTSETTSSNDFASLVNVLLEPLNNIASLMSDFIDNIAIKFENEPIAATGTSQISMQNLNNTNIGGNTITPADGVMQGGNSLNYTSFNNSQYTDLLAGQGDNKDVVEKLNDIYLALNNYFNDRKWNNFTNEPGQGGGGGAN